MTVDSFSTSILGNLNDWSQASCRQRQEVVNVVHQRFAELLDSPKLSSFQAADRCFEIATFRHRPTKLNLHLIPGGTFERGSNTTPWAFDKPVQLVTVEPFLIGESPVIQSVWDGIGGEDNRCWHGEQRPIEKVTVVQVKAWLKKASGGLHLPSEAEWEYACRSGASTDYFWGQEFDERYVWCKDNSGMQTQPVTAHAEYRNGFGLIDTLGHVWEWCEDDFLEDYQGARLDSLPYLYPQGERRYVYRGGGWNGRAPNLKCSNRNGRGENYGFSMVGFRVAMSLQ
jgi:formylglycine-generating enzyme required for sulfatase activity